MVLQDFVEASHDEKGERVKLLMKKEAGDSGFCLRARGGPQAIKKLAEDLGGIDLK